MISWTSTCKFYIYPNIVFIPSYSTNISGIQKTINLTVSCEDGTIFMDKWTSKVMDSLDAIVHEKTE